MAVQKYPIINGNHFSFASAIIKLTGKSFYGINSLNYGDKLEMEDVPGNGSMPLGVSVGAYSATSDMEMLTSEAKLLRAELGQPTNARAFNVVVFYEETPGAGTHLVEFTARLMEDSAARSRSATGAVEKLTLKVVGAIRRDGLTLAEMRQGGSPVGVSVGGISLG